VGDRRVQVIDFDGFRDGLPLEDVAHFLVQLRLLLAYPLTGKPFAELARAFLEGFSSQPVDHDTLQLFVMARSLEALASGGRAERGRVRGFYHRAALRKAIIKGLL
jgi:Ser/Thr protein kinase RdoA (MazF antagonist)